MPNSDNHQDTAGSELMKQRLLTALPKELGTDLHICRPISHTKDPWKEGYKGYSDMEKEHPEYANCVWCGAKPSQMRYETMTEGMIGFNAAINQFTKAVEKVYGDIAVQEEQK